MQRYHQIESGRNYVNNSSRDWIAQKIDADVNNPIFRSSEKWTEIGLNVATLYYTGRSVFNLLRTEFNFGRLFQSGKKLFSGSKGWNQFDLLSNKRAYSGLDVEQLSKMLKIISQQE
jgi:hypothetical protein